MGSRPRPQPRSRGSRSRSAASTGSSSTSIRRTSRASACLARSGSSRRRRLRRRLPGADGEPPAGHGRLHAVRRRARRHTGREHRRSRRTTLWAAHSGPDLRRPARRSSTTSPKRITSVRCPSSSRSIARAPGTCSPATRRARTGPSRPGGPATPSRAPRCRPSAKPQGRVNARSSSSQPQIPLETAARNSRRLVLGELAGDRRPVDVGRRGRRASRRRSRAVTAASSAREGLEEPLERVFAGERGPELVAVLVGHPVEPVEALGAPRSDAGQRRRRRDEAGEERGARERVWAAARPADDVQPVELEVRRDRRHVLRAVGDRSSCAARRARVAGPRVGDESPTAALGLRHERRRTGRPRTACRSGTGARSTRIPSLDHASICRPSGSVIVERARRSSRRSYARWPPLPWHADVERPRHAGGLRAPCRSGRLAPRSPSPQGGARSRRPLREGSRAGDRRPGTRATGGAHRAVGSPRDPRRRDRGPEDAAPRGAQGVPAASDPRHAHARRLPRGAPRPPDPGDGERPVRRRVAGREAGRRRPAGHPRAPRRGAADVGARAHRRRHLGARGR